MVHIVTTGLERVKWNAALVFEWMTVNCNSWPSGRNFTTMRSPPDDIPSALTHRSPSRLLHNAVWSRSSRRAQHCSVTGRHGQPRNCRKRPAFHGSHTLKCGWMMHGTFAHEFPLKKTRQFGTLHIHEDGATFLKRWSNSPAVGLPLHLPPSPHLERSFCYPLFSLQASERMSHCACWRSELHRRLLPWRRRHYVSEFLHDSTASHPTTVTQGWRKPGGQCAQATIFPSKGPKICAPSSVWYLFHVNLPRPTFV